MGFNMNIIELLQKDKVTINGDDYVVTNIEKRDGYNDGIVIINIIAEKVAKIENITIMSSTKESD